MEKNLILHRFQNIAHIFQFIERSPTQPYKGGQLPQESYLSHNRVGHFRHLFLHFFSNLNPYFILLEMDKEKAYPYLWASHFVRNGN